MARFHHTKAETLDLTRIYGQAFYKKPLGLWYDIDCSWSEWCKHNEYRSDCNNHFLLEIEFQDVLVIDSMERLKVFDAEFGFNPDDLKGKAGDFREVNWKRLAKYYTGIEIAPHQEFPDFQSLHWYDRWDVASGCIWDLSAIKAVVKVEHLTKFDL